MLRKYLRNSLILTIPAIVCVLVFLLPVNFQESLILKMTSINLWSWFTYIFVHQNFNHLFFNLLVYIPVILLTYAIIPVNEKRDFYKIVAISIILVPLFTLSLTIIMHNFNLLPLFANSRGFSGISSMALGMLTFAISKRIQEKFGNLKNKLFLLNTCYLILFPSLAIMVFNISFKFTLFIFLFWGFAIFNFAYYLRRNKLKINKIETKAILPILGAFFLLLIGVSLLIPVEIIKEGVVTNTLAHLIGYVVGFIIVFIYYFKDQDPLIL